MWCCCWARRDLHGGVQCSISTQCSKVLSVQGLGCVLYTHLIVIIHEVIIQVVILIIFRVLCWRG